MTSFDPGKIVAAPESSIASGAVAEWSTRHSYYYSMLESVAAHYGFDLEQPFISLSESVRNIVLHGSGSEKIAMRYESSKRSGLSKFQTI